MPGVYCQDEIKREEGSVSSSSVQFHKIQTVIINISQMRKAGLPTSTRNLGRLTLVKIQNSAIPSSKNDASGFPC